MNLLKILNPSMPGSAYDAMMRAVKDGEPFDRKHLVSLARRQGLSCRAADKAGTVMLWHLRLLGVVQRTRSRSKWIAAV